MSMFIKSTVAAAAIAITSTVALADNSFAFQELAMSDNLVTLETVTSDADGVVVIYDYTGGEFGEALGMQEVNAGANADVKIPLNVNGAQEFAAVLYHGAASTPDQSVAWTELEIES